MAPKSLGPPATVAFIGLGKMGAPMAAHLVAGGWIVRGFDLSAAALIAFVVANARAVAATSAADAAAGADVAITMLPDGQAVRQAVLAAGAAKALGPGGLLIDMSSSSPLDTARLGEEVAAYGVGLVDAPVSGGSSARWRPSFRSWLVAIRRSWSAAGRSSLPWGRRSMRPARSAAATR